MANIIVPDVDKIWESLPDTPLRPLDAVIEFLHKLEQGINPPDYSLVEIHSDVLMHLGYVAFELANNLEDLRDALTPENESAESRSGVRVRRLQNSTLSVYTRQHFDDEKPA